MERGEWNFPSCLQRQASYKDDVVKFKGTL